MTTTVPDWIAVDWGTSHVRLWMMSNSGAIVGRATSEQGMSKIGPADYEPALLSMIGDFLPDRGAVPVVICGMAGSRQGWKEARYIQLPCAVETMASATHVETNDKRIAVRILPGISQLKPDNVMRGEETQIAGFLASEPDFSGVICLPGTHCKWVAIDRRVIRSFSTFMTGEVFALLAQQSVLRHSVAQAGLDMDAFQSAVSLVMDEPNLFLSELFSIRAQSLLSGLEPLAARSRLSGLLIGAELASSKAEWHGRDIVIVGASGIAKAYSAALEAHGANPRMVDAEEMTLNGLRAAHQIKHEAAE